VLRNWDTIKKSEAGREPGIFGEVPNNLPALLHARKVQRRASSNGLSGLSDASEAASLIAQLAAQSAAADGDREASFASVGELLFAVVTLAQILAADPELALRAASARFRDAVELAQTRAQQNGRPWEALTADEKLQYYAMTRMEQSG
jgi:uncharacterized protein YabN with tetrapyrrole methylase and pyrophosphatase domain